MEASLVPLGITGGNWWKLQSADEAWCSDKGNLLQAEEKPVQNSGGFCVIF